MDLFDIMHFPFKFVTFSQEKYQIITQHFLLLLVNSPTCFGLTYWTLCGKFVLDLFKCLD